jgi:hypothetical protein
MPSPIVRRAHPPVPGCRHRDRPRCRRAVKAGNDAHGRVIGFFTAGQHADLDAQQTLGLRDEIGPVCRLSRGRGCKNIQVGVTFHVPGRKARIGHEIFLRVERLLALAANNAPDVPSGNTSKLCWLSLRFATMIWSSTCLMHGRVGDRNQHLDPAVEVARHQVGRARYRPAFLARRQGHGHCRSRRCGCARGSGRRST